MSVVLQTIQQAVKLHDKYQVEFKLDYELLDGKKTCYRISTYIFIPQSLGVNRHTYTKADFYRDIQSYIRLKTPPLILRDFTEHSASPLLSIEKLTAIENWASDRRCKERLIDNLKFISAILKSAMREHFNLIYKRVHEATPDSKIPLIIGNLVEEFLVESRKITEKYRSFYAIFNLPNVDDRLFTSYKFTDESISLLLEESAVEMFQIVEDYITKKSNRALFQEKLSELVQAETKYRRSVGYGSILNEGDDNEVYVFRASVLKKYAASVLHLSTAVKPEGTGLEQMLFAIAAGISMIFATIVAFYFQQQYGNFTFPFFIALVVGYMFKDRIKEFARSLFSKYLQDILYDRRTIIRTQDGRHKLGLLREKVSFLNEKDIPRGVMRARNRDEITDLDNEGLGEWVLCYTKEITLFTNAFKGVFGEALDITGINDISRYDIRAYLKKMADPIQERHYLEAGQLKIIPAHKVYHLNVISRYRSLLPHKEKITRRMRLVLNRQGLKRIEHIPM